MTSIYVIVSIQLCLKVGKDEYIVESIFGGRRMSIFEVIGEGGGSPRSPPPPLSLFDCLFWMLQAMQDFPGGQNLR